MWSFLPLLLLGLLQPWPAGSLFTQVVPVDTYTHTVAYNSLGLGAHCTRADREISDVSSDDMTVFTHRSHLRHVKLK